MAKIKLIAKREAFYKLNLVKKGAVIEIDEKEKVPTWAKVIGKRKIKEEASKEPKEQDKVSEANQQQESATEEPKENNLQDKSEEELQEIFENLITEALEYELLYVDTENKPLVQQIEELENAIKLKKEQKNV